MTTVAKTGKTYIARKTGTATIVRKPATATYRKATKRPINRKDLENIAEYVRSSPEPTDELKNAVARFKNRFPAAS